MREKSLSKCGRSNQPRTREGRMRRQLESFRLLPEVRIFGLSAILSAVHSEPVWLLN